MKTNKSNPEVRQIIQDIRAAYVPTMAYDRLDEYFDQLLEQRRADLAEGILDLAILAFGIRSYREFLFGSAALAAYYYMSKDDGSLDGAVTGLSGVQLARGQYLTAAFPTFIETYQSFKEWREGRFMTRKQILKLFIYVSGFYLGLKKMV